MPLGNISAVLSASTAGLRNLVYVCLSAYKIEDTPCFYVGLRYCSSLDSFPSSIIVIITLNTEPIVRDILYN